MPDALPPRRPRPRWPARWLPVGCLLVGVGFLVGWACRPAGSSGVASFAPVVAACRASVVGVRALLHPDAAGSERGATAISGSGFVVHEDGLILTNYHLVEGQMLVVVEFADRGRLFADVVGEDPLTDLAVLRLAERPAQPLMPLRFGDSETLSPGDWVVTVGHPFEFRHTVTAGVVSHVGRHLPRPGSAVTSEHLQFTAPVNPGSSGSPVLDVHGAVVGVTSRKLAPGEGISFAVPSRVVRWVLEAMDAHGGRVPRGYLGVSLDPRPVQRLGRPGVLVTHVEKDQPAWSAGLRPRDVLLGFEGRSTGNAAELYDWIVRAGPDRPVAIEAVRDTWPAARTLTVVLGAVDNGVEAAIHGETEPSRRRPVGS